MSGLISSYPVAKLLHNYKTMNLIFSSASHSVTLTHTPIEDKFVVACGTCTTDLMPVPHLTIVIKYDTLGQYGRH